MKDAKFRKALDAYGVEREISFLVLDDHAYDNSIIGITDGGRLVYDYEMMIHEYMEDEGCDELEAIEWMDENVMRSLPYYEDAPIIIHPRSDIEEYED